MGNYGILFHHECLRVFIKLLKGRLFCTWKIDFLEQLLDWIMLADSNNDWVNSYQSSLCENYDKLLEWSRLEMFEIKKTFWFEIRFRLFFAKQKIVVCILPAGFYGWVFFLLLVLHGKQDQGPRHQERGRYRGDRDTFGGKRLKTPSVFPWKYFEYSLWLFCLSQN